MNQPGAVRVAQPARHLPGEVDHARLGQRPLAPDHGGQGLALGVLHREVEQPALGLAEVEDRDDVGMRHPAGRVRLVREAQAHRRIGRDVAEHQLEREQPAQPRVVRAVDQPHRALADQRLDHVALGQGGSDERVVRGADQRDAVAHAPGEVAAERGVAAGAAQPRDRLHLHGRRAGRQPLALVACVSVSTADPARSRLQCSLLSRSRTARRSQARPTTRARNAFAYTHLDPLLRLSRQGAKAS